MKDSLGSPKNYKPANKRTIALVLLICFISISLFSRTFIAIHAGHVHDHNGVGGSCATCVQIQSGENLLRLFSTAVDFGFTIFAGYYAAIRLVRAIYSNMANLTPIAAKTRMNN